jgi:hypothetical protein
LCRALLFDGRLPFETELEGSGIPQQAANALRESVHNWQAGLLELLQDEKEQAGLTPDSKPEALSALLLAMT